MKKFNGLLVIIVSFSLAMLFTSCGEKNKNDRKKNSPAPQSENADATKGSDETVVQKTTDTVPTTTDTKATIQSLLDILGGDPLKALMNLANGNGGDVMGILTKLISGGSLSGIVGDTQVISALQTLLSGKAGDPMAILKALAGDSGNIADVFSKLGGLENMGNICKMLGQTDTTKCFTSLLSMLSGSK